jgi:hypothetical protein
MKIKKPRANLLSSEEKEIIERNIDIMSVDELAALLGRNRKSIYCSLVKRYKIEDHWNLYDIHPSVFLNPSTPEVAYVLGFLWGDGHVNNEKKSISFSIVRSDLTDIKETFFKLGKWQSHENKKRDDRQRVGTLSTCNGVISNFLTENDYEEKSLKSPDKILALIPENLQKYFFRGWFDSDGGISLSKIDNNPNVSISGSYNQDWNALTDLGRKIGVEFIVTRRTRPTGNLSEINVNKLHHQQRFLDYIYEGREVDEIGLYRKFAKYLKASDKYARNNKGKDGLGVARYNDHIFYSFFRIDKKRYKIGTFSTAEEAQLCYDHAVFEKEGIYARTNFPIKNYINLISEPLE